MLGMRVLKDLGIAIRSKLVRRRRWKNKLIDSINVKPLPDITDAPLNFEIKPGNVEYVAYAAYMGFFEGRLKIKDQKS